MTKRERVGLTKMQEIEKKLRAAGYGEQIDAKNIWLNWSGEIALSREMQSRAAATEISKITGARVEGWEGSWGLNIDIKFPKMTRRYRYI